MKENFYIEDWLVQPSLNRISLGEQEWKLEPKIMQVLCELAKTPKEVVTRDYLFDTVWENTVVVDMVLTRAISELRSIFKDSPTSPKVIETIPKGGYRLIGQIRDQHNNSSDIEEASTKPSRNRYILLSAAVVFITIVVFLTAGSISVPNNKTFNVKPLTSLKGWEFEPDISPDGKSVVFLWKEPDQNTTHICTKFIDGTEHKIITDTPGYYFAPKWSPNGDQIAFYNNDQGYVSVNIIQAYGGKSRKIIESKAQVAALSWSPDGEKLAFVEVDTVNNQHAIFLYSISKDESVQLTLPPENYWGDTSPRFSRDGSRLAFIRTLNEGMQDLYSIHLSNNKIEQLTEISSNIYGFDWEEGGNLILSSDYDGQISLWELHYKKGNSLQKLALGRDKRNPSVFQNTLVAEEWNTDTDLWSIDLSDSSAEPRALVQSTYWDLSPDISKNGRKVVFASNQSGSYEIWSVNFDGKNMKKLTNINKSLASNPKWSPEDDIIAFDSQVDGFSHIYLVDSTGNDQYQFTRGNHNDMAPSWSSKGDFIYFASDRSGSWQLWKKPTNGNKAIQITNEGGFYGIESSDGSKMYYTKSKQNGLWVRDLESGQDQLLLRDLHTLDWGNWGLDEKGVYYLRRLNNRQNSELRHFNVKSLTIDKVMPIANMVPGQDPTVSIAPDGKKAIFGRINGFSGDLVHINNL